MSASTTTTTATVAPARHGSAGLVAALVAAAAFGSSGAFAKSLLETGWTPGSAVFVRIAGAAALLLVPTVLAMRGHWHLLRRGWPQVLVYGGSAVALPQAAYFFAVQHLSVGVALLLEYLGLLLVVAWVSLSQRRLPSRATQLGVVLAVAGLVLVLDLPGLVLSGETSFSLVGLGWGLLAAVGLASFFVLSSSSHEASLPPMALAGGGLLAATVLFAVLGLTGLLPMTFATDDVALAGLSLPWWVPVLELAAVAAATAYVAGIWAARWLGATVASFLGLGEVLFAVLFAWLLLSELPTLVQLAGGALVLGGVVVVRLEQVRADARGARGAAVTPTDTGHVLAG